VLLLLLLLFIQHLSASSLHQLQLDVLCLREEIPLALPDASSEQSKELAILLDETLISAHERAPDATPLDDAAVAEAYDASRAQKPSPLNADAAPAASAASDSSKTVPASASASPAPAQPTGALARLVLDQPRH